jgi:hypothetical protein
VMYESTLLILIAFNIVFDLLAFRLKATLLSDMAGLVTLFGLAFLVADGSIIVGTGFNAATDTFYNQLGSASDYQVFVVLLVIFTATSFLISMGMGWSKSKPSW